MGQYRVVRKLAEGGMAEVLLGKLVGSGGFEKPIAIKRMLPEVARDPANAAAFLREARLCVHLVHPNVVQVMDLGTARGQPFLVMELVDGEDLRKVIRAAQEPKPAIDVKEALHVATCVAEALAYAYDAPGPSGQPLQVVHRDVNPSNVLISMRGEVKLADFGVAKAADGGEATQGNVIKGKLQYLAPEVLLGNGGGHASDIFLTGALLYELIAGKALFAVEKGAAPGQVLVAISHFDDAKLELPAAVPEALAPVLRKALAREPEARYPHARDLAAALHEVIAAAGLRLSQSELAARMAARFPERPRLDASAAAGELLEEPPMLHPGAARSANPPARPASAAGRPPAPPQAARAPKPIAGGVRRKLGELLIEAGVITAGQLQNVLGRQRAEGGRVGQWVVNLEYATEEQLLPVLARQLGIRWVADERLLALTPEPELLRKFGEEQARRLLALPLAARAGQVLVAMANPNDMHQVDEVRFLLGSRVVVAIASEAALREAIPRAYGQRGRWGMGRAEFAPPPEPPTRWLDASGRTELSSATGTPSRGVAAPLLAAGQPAWPQGVPMAYVQAGVGPDGAPILVPVPMAAPGTPAPGTPAPFTPPGYVYGPALTRPAPAPLEAEPVQHEELEIALDDAMFGR